MAFCTNCGKELKSDEKFCPACGTAQAAAAQNDGTSNVPPIVNIPTPGGFKGRTLNTGLLIWSILNLVFCCMPLGVASLIMTVLAKDAPTEEEESKKLKTAKICNLIGTIGSVVFYVVYFILVIALGLLGSL